MLSKAIASLIAQQASENSDFILHNSKILDVCRPIQGGFVAVEGSGNALLRPKILYERDCYFYEGLFLQKPPWVQVSVAVTQISHFSVLYFKVILVHNDGG